MAVAYLTNGNDDGSSVGLTSAEKISLYGVTPVTQAATVTGPATTACSLAGYGFATTTQADAIVSAVNSILTTLKNIGVLASA